MPYSNISLNTETSFNVPMRLIRSPGSRLYFRGRGKEPLIFGNIYLGAYYNPVGRSGDVLERLRKLPIHDVIPLFIFLQWTTKTQTILGLNLHFTTPMGYGNEPMREPGGDDNTVRLYQGEEGEDPVGTREIVIAMVNLIKTKLRMHLGESIEDNIFEQQGVDIDEIERKYFEMTKQDYDIYEGIIESTARGQQGLDWGAITQIDNRYFRMLKVLFRQYKFKKLSMVENIDNFSTKERSAILQDEGLIKVAGGGRWTKGMVNRTLRVAMNNPSSQGDDSWRGILNRMIRNKRQRYQ